MRSYIVCNWKMHPSSFDKARELLGAYNKLFRVSRGKQSGGSLVTQIVICPPFLYFQLFDEKRGRNISLGAQNIFFRDGEGSYTGQISARMVREFGAEYVLIGHGEVRRLGEGSSSILLKVQHALRRGIKPIICVGYQDHVRETRHIITHFSADEVQKMIFAYEPTDAVGTGNPETPEVVARAVHDIKRLIFKRFKKKYFLGLVGIGGSKYLVPRPPILYGGSVTPDNYKRYIANSDVDGFVIGKESLNAESIKKIADALEGKQ
mgnify:CR=1 FL=1